MVPNRATHDISSSHSSESRTSYNNHASQLLIKQKISFSLRISSVNVTIADLVTFTQQILHWKVHFLCSGLSYIFSLDWLNAIRILMVLAIMFTFTGFLLAVAMFAKSHIRGLFLTLPMIPSGKYQWYFPK